MGCSDRCDYDIRAMKSQIRFQDGGRTGVFFSEHQDGSSRLGALSWRRLWGQTGSAAIEFANAASAQSERTGKVGPSDFVSARGVRTFGPASRSRFF
jgi:hypothetical protein